MLTIWLSSFKSVHAICCYIILPVLYECGTWSLTLREEHKLRVFENRAQRRILGSKKEEVAGCCRRLHNEELHNLYALQNVIRIIKSRSVGWAGHVAENLSVDGRIILNCISWK